MPLKRSTIRGLLADLFFLGLVQSMAAVALFLAYRDIGLSAASLAIAAPYALMCAVRRYLRVLPLFMLTNIALIMSPLLLPAGIIVRVVAIAGLVILFIYTLFNRLNAGWSPEFGTSFAILLILAALTVMCDYFALGGVRLFPITWAFIIIVSQITIFHFRRVDSSLDVLKENFRSRISSVRRFNDRLLGAFFLPALALGIAAVILPLNEWIAYIGRLLLFALRWLFSLIGPSDPGEEAAAPQPIENAAPPGLAELAGETPAWIRILDMIFTFVMQVAVAALIILGVGYLLLQFYKRFQSSVTAADGDERESIFPEPAAEGLPGLLSGLMRRLPFFGWDERERIRRAYFRKVRAHIRKGVSVRRADTAGQIADKISPAEDIGGLTESYNKARYGK
jgi:hypothetical protein